MALIKCPECSREISDKAGSCPNCGLPLTGISTPSKTVTCLDCKTEFDFEAEVCPHCGLFNSQKYKSTDENDSSEFKFSSDTAPSSTSNNNSRKFAIGGMRYFAVTIVVTIILLSIFKTQIASAFIILLCIAFSARAIYIDKHQDDISNFEMFICSLKGIIVIFITTAVISYTERLVTHFKLENAKKQRLELISVSAKDHLSKAKSLLAKAPNLSDEEWLSLNNHLTSIDSSTPEYTEASNLLPPVAQKRDAIIKKRLEEKRNQEKIEEKNRFDQETAGLNAKGKRLKKKHPEWSIEDCDTISKNRIQIGMDEEQVKAAWGRPYRVNTTTTAYGTHEQWVMHEMGSTYVYFENGICTSIQN